jgi:hypothetical protein
LYFLWIANVTALDVYSYFELNPLSRSRMCLKRPDVKT